MVDIEDYVKQHSNTLKLAIDQNYEEAINMYERLSVNPDTLMILNCVFEMTIGIIVGINVEDSIAKFNSFSENIKMVAKQYIDEYFCDTYKDMLYEKLEFGTQK